MAELDDVMNNVAQSVWNKLKETCRDKKTKKQSKKTNATTDKKYAPLP